MDSPKANKRRALHSYQNEANSGRDWYFGAITRSEAENILIADGLSEGLFLVRQSMSSSGDYVLSCVHKASIVHYQIQRIGDDPLFSLAGGPVVHGLDVLLERLRDSNQPESRCLFLRHHCSGSQPPPQTLRHGKSNLLHRSVAAADLTVVSELLSAGTNYNLEARDERGRTALHIAVTLDQRKHWQIVERLIAAGANPDCRDSESITPLHLCAKLNKHKFVRLLMCEGKASSCVRTREEGWVPLHLAAHFGSFKAMEVLLECGAAPHPRSNKNETPTDLALERNHLDCVQLCHLYSDRPIDHLEPTNQWLCEHLKSRCESDALLETNSSDGTFLVRKSSSNEKTYVLSMTYNRKVYNFVIQYDNGFYFIDSGPYWPSLEHLIWYHKRNSDGLPSRLSVPLLSVINTAMTEKFILADNENNDRSQLNRNDDNESVKSILFIDASQVRAGPLIGSGEYADVLRGHWNRGDQRRNDIALKILRNSDIRRKRFDRFLEEVKVMAALKHPSIVKLMGVCLGQPLVMIQELAPMGNLLEFLVDHFDQVDVPQRLTQWSIQIADGMQYLENKHFVHRDLAARNILLFSMTKVKISDFGLSRALKSDEEVYASSSRDRWPLRWYAPEALRYGIFTHASDVWSFGVLVWEMFSRGDHPYGETDNTQILSYIEDGKRLSKPEECSEAVYGLMCFCWAYEPKNRPSFSQIVKLMLTNDSTLESMRNELKSAIQI